MDRQVPLRRPASPLALFAEQAMLRRLLVIPTLALLPVTVLAGDHNAAEMAIRWDPQTAPVELRSAPAVLDFLAPAQGDRTNEAPDDYILEYYAVGRPETLPTDVDVIARKRVKNGKKHELMIKYRSARELSAIMPTQRWECPLARHFPGLPAQTKYETDISFGAHGNITRLHSLSCTVEASEPIAFPAAFSPRALGAARKMQRVAAQQLKIDTLSETDGIGIIEVSSESRDTARQIDAFYARVALPLIEKGVVPILSNKSTM